jgi:hypothetical protein
MPKVSTASVEGAYLCRRVQYCNCGSNPLIEGINAMKSPTMHMALAIPMYLGDIETIDAFAVPLWEPSLERMVDITRDREDAVERCLNPQEIEVQIFTDGSIKNGKVGYSVLVWVDNAIRTYV